MRATETTTTATIAEPRLTCCMFLEIQVSSRSPSLCSWYLRVLFTAMKSSCGLRCSTGPRGALPLPGDPTIALLCRVSFLKYAEKTLLPPKAAGAGAAAAAAGQPGGSPLLRSPTAAKSRQLTSRLPTEGPLIVDPPEASHFVAKWTALLPLPSWEEAAAAAASHTSPRRRPD